MRFYYDEDCFDAAGPEGRGRLPRALHPAFDGASRSHDERAVVEAPLRANRFFRYSRRFDLDFSRFAFFEGPTRRIRISDRFRLGWILFALVETFRLHSASLAFYAIFMALFLVACWSWLGVELKRSFFDPRMSWYEGLPRPIPGLTCEIVGEKEAAVFRVCRIDREGAFVFHAADASASRAQTPVLAPRELVFAFRDREVRCSAVPVRAFSRAEGFRGLGFQFDRMSPDACKRLGDFVELLKGEGYVS